MKRREWLKALLAIPFAAVAAKIAPSPQIHVQWFWCDNEDAFDVVERLRAACPDWYVELNQHRVVARRLNCSLLDAREIPTKLRQQIEDQITIEL